MASIVPVSFYGGKGIIPSSDMKMKADVQFHQKLRKIEEKSKVFMERPLMETKRKSIFAPHRIWEKFPTQSQALEFQKRCKKSTESRIFIVSEELSTDGKRHFIVSSFGEFWRRYRGLTKEKRHFYEVIPEGQLCRLYFDLEFYKTENPGLQGTDTVEVFIDLVCFYLLGKLNISCNRGNIIDLDSSTKDKFSRHLIFHIKNTVFCNNIECGNFVIYIYEMARRKLIRNNDSDLNNLKAFEFDLVEELDPPDNIDIGKLFVNNKDGKKAFFADIGVYTKNRNFRLYGSSKFGKDVQLVISDENGFHVSYDKKNKLNREEFDPQYFTFLDTLVCYYEKVPSDLNIVTFAHYHGAPGKHYMHQREGVQQKVEEGHKLSPYPKLDKFILTQAKKGGIQGIIRRWMHFVHSSVMLYDIDRNHYCENIGRAHKSNHIYFIVDMRCGTFYQKCHDPDCIDFKSDEKELPEGINPFLNDSDFLIEYFDDSSSQLLFDAAEIAECEESFVDDDFNDHVELCDEKTQHETGKSVINLCENEEDFLADFLMLEDLDDDWDLNFMKETEENLVGVNSSRTEHKITPDFVDEVDIDSKKGDEILKESGKSAKKECKEVQYQAVSANNSLCTERNISLRDLHPTEMLKSHLSGESYLAPSELSNFEVLSDKTRKDEHGIINKSAGFFEKKMEENTYLPFSLNVYHKERDITSCNFGDNSFDTSLVRCELSDLYLDSDLEDELVKLDQI